MTLDFSGDQLVAQRISYKKTKRGKIRKLVKEIYLRDDIGCGFLDCQTCSQQEDAVPGKLSLDCESIIIPDDNVLTKQKDFLFDDSAFIGNDLSVVCLYSSMKTYDARFTRKFNDKTNFHILPNDFMRELFVDFPNVETDASISERSFKATIRAAEWYNAHLSGSNMELSSPNTLPRLFILTDNEARVEEAKALGIDALTLNEFVNRMQPKYPNCGEKIAWSKLESSDSQQDGELKLEDGAMYPAYATDAEIAAGLASGRFVQGTLRMAMGTCMRASVGDIEVEGKMSLNRALEADVVIVELIESRKDSKQKNSTSSDDSESEIETAGTEMMDRIAEQSATKQGRVVSIVKRSLREICGTLRPLPEGITNINNRVFIPADPRFPFVMINTKMAESLEGMRIVAVIDNWDRFSRHPNGHWLKILGRAGDRNTESAVILHEHDVITREFSEDVLRCLPPSNFTPDESEISKRLDLRKVIVCSIDPPGCKDIDDALSCEILPNGNFRVGVHIADVTHFVLPGSAIDKEAAQRCTTVYLVEKRTDMLPSLLTTDLCSLRHSVDRLTFTVLWEVKPDTCEIVNTTYHKAIIHSCASLTYADAQHKIEDSNDKSDLAESIRRLNYVAKKLRAKRMGKGALELASQEVRFELDSETMDPTNVKAYESRDTNKLVEEFMLLGNQAVAEKILQNFPTTSILRRHPPPKDAHLEKLRKLLSQHGVKDFSFETNRELSDSLAKAVRLSDPYFNKLIRIMTTRTMNQAVYFCTGECDPGLFYHYGLAMELYTHFTSPIRRYADVMAHRLLAAALGLTPLPEELGEKKLVQIQCEVINYKHRNAQFAGRASTDLHTYLFFKRRGETEANAVVSGIRRTARGDPSLSITVPAFGIEGLVPLDHDIWSIDQDELKLTNSRDGYSLSVFDYVSVRVRAEDKDFRFRTTFEILRKSEKRDMPEETEEMRKQVEAEMFPDRIEERPDRI